MNYFSEFSFSGRSTPTCLSIASLFSPCPIHLSLLHNMLASLLSDLRPLFFISPPNKRVQMGKNLLLPLKVSAKCSFLFLPSCLKHIIHSTPVYCGCFINIPIHNNPESSLFLHGRWYLPVTYNTDLQGPFSPGKCRFIILVCQSIFFAIPPSGDWWGGLVMRLGSLAFKSGSLKPNRMYFLLMWQYFSIS